MNRRFGVERLSKLVSEIKQLRQRQRLPLVEQGVVPADGPEDKVKPIRVWEPEEEWERPGDVPNVAFGCGQVMTDDTLYLRCGAAGTVTSMATADKEQVLAFRRA